MSGNVEPLKPYVGPRPFFRKLEDQSRFFGRHTETDEIVSLITSHRLTLVYAQSGAGKTSIFNTQVTRVLENYGFEVLPVARVRLTNATNITGIASLGSNDKSKSRDQIENLYIYNAIQSLCSDNESQLPFLLTESVTPTSTLFEFLDDYFPNCKDENGDLRPQVLIFDQLEELFSYYPTRWMEQQKDFFEQVTDSLENNPRLRIVFIIREDHLAKLDSFKSILSEKLRPRFRLERLRRDQAMLAIKCPIANIVSSYSQDEIGRIELEQEKLVNYLLKVKVENSDGGSQQLEGEFIEPILLQVVCQSWWDERESKGPIKDLEDLTNVDEALEDFYEAAILDASSKTKIKEQDIRTWCQEKLITSSGTRSTGT